MKNKTIFRVIVLVVVLFTTICVFASDGYLMTYYPGTADTVMNLPESEIKTPEESYFVSSQIPKREGYEFLGWILDYGSTKYKVDYEVKSDPVYGMPENIILPMDPTQYLPGNMVTVASLLNTTQNFAINKDTGEERPGTWTFIPWDRTDFKIYEDTTITGEWKFISKYKYTVHHLDVDTYEQLADDEINWLDDFGQVTELSKVPKTEFFTKYRLSKYNPVTLTVYQNKHNDFLLPGASYVKNKTKYEMTVTITEDDQHIFFFYQRPSAG